ncbi:hypothetical protein, partial [Chitinophaga sp.]|uniref:hypothetical protein n=1 Tax=Chitinophaga sp. TaxID=1869181 RepID=UPI0031DA9734
GEVDGGRMEKWGGGVGVRFGGSLCEGLPAASSISKKIVLPEAILFFLVLPSHKFSKIVWHIRT